MSETETQIFRAAYRYLAAHASVPITDSTAWWEHAAKDMSELGEHWNHHPLMTKLMLAIYEYLEEVAHEFPQKP